MSFSDTHPLRVATVLAAFGSLLKRIRIALKPRIVFFEAFVVVALGTLHPDQCFSVSSSYFIYLSSVIDLLFPVFGDVEALAQECLPS